MKNVLNTPIKDSDIVDLNIGDVIYLTGNLVLARDDCHRRVVKENILPGFDLKNMAIMHAGPIVKKASEGYEMISVGPTTSMRMEHYEKEFIEKTGVKLIIGKGGMGINTQQACNVNKVIHCVFPGGCAVICANLVEKIESVEWEDFGMPEALWVLSVKEFGPLIVSIDTKGNSLFERNKKLFSERKEVVINDILNYLQQSHND